MDFGFVDIGIVVNIPTLCLCSDDLTEMQTECSALAALHSLLLSGTL